MYILSKQVATVYVGRKPLMNYVLAVITGFTGGAEEVTLKARGRALSRAVDVAEVARSRFLGDVKVGKIEIGSEEISIEEQNRTRNVSTIEITLTRAKPKAKAKVKRKRRKKEKKE
jgi:DNA-binding protein